MLQWLCYNAGFNTIVDNDYARFYNLILILTLLFLLFVSVTLQMCLIVSPV